MASGRRNSECYLFLERERVFVVLQVSFHAVVVSKAGPLLSLRYKLVDTRFSRASRK